MKRQNKIAVGAAAVLAAAGGGGAIAASQTGSPSEESNAIIDDAAKQLGISPSRLSDALKTALSDRVDAAVAAGRLTKAEGDAIKERIQSDDFPVFGGLHRGFGHFAKLDAAAEYLGLTEAQLRSELQGGKSLAQVATDRGKSVDGLVDVLVAAAKEHLDNAVAAGRLTQAQEDEMLAGLKERITSLVNSTGLEGLHFGRPGVGFRPFDGPPA
jgi:hypothetical protein